MNQPRIAIVGATGVVGQMFLTVLEERKIPFRSLVLFASKKSAGQTISYQGETYTILELNEANISANLVDVALFSAGGDVSKIYAPLFVKLGAKVIDNSSYFRMHPEFPLVVPEVNPEDLKGELSIIANPNCSTVQAVVALKPLHDRYSLKRIVIATYQAVSGAGSLGIHDLETRADQDHLKKFPYPIHQNLIPHIDVFLENGYTKEEMKMVNEMRKILHLPSLAITATAVRVPVLNAHSEAINVTFEKPLDLNEVRTLLKNAPGVVLYDDLSSLIYPMPSVVSGQDHVYVGRLRIDESFPNTLNMFVVGDNIRKGSATNAVQILKEILN
jgi:aspartate-semialdehyde dehydrogenase